MGGSASGSMGHMSNMGGLAACSVTDSKPMQFPLAQRRKRRVLFTQAQVSFGDEEKSFTFLFLLLTCRSFFIRSFRARVFGTMTSKVIVYRANISHKVTQFPLAVRSDHFFYFSQVCSVRALSFYFGFVKQLLPVLLLAAVNDYTFKKMRMIGRKHEKGM